MEFWETNLSPMSKVSNQLECNHRKVQAVQRQTRSFSRPQLASQAPRRELLAAGLAGPGEQKSQVQETECSDAPRVRSSQFGGGADTHALSRPGPPRCRPVFARPRHCGSGTGIHEAVRTAMQLRAKNERRDFLSGELQVLLDSSFFFFPFSVLGPLWADSFLVLRDLFGALKGKQKDSQFSGANSKRRISPEADSALASGGSTAGRPGEPCVPEVAVSLCSAGLGRKGGYKGMGCVTRKETFDLRKRPDSNMAAFAGVAETGMGNCKEMLLQIGGGSFPGV